MPETDTIHTLEADAGAEFLNYGPPEGPVEVAESFGQFEAEYAAIRQRVAIMHLPHRAVLSFTGGDRQDFLHRMLTQEMNALKGGATTRAFQLNVKGRILADLIVHHGDASTWLEMDRFDMPDVMALYDSHLFADDVVMEDWTAQRTGLALHGPAAIDLLREVCDQDPQPMADMPNTHHVLTIEGAHVTVYRRDVCGVPGFGLWVPSEHATAVYEVLLKAAGYEANAPDPATDREAAAAFAQRRRESLRGRPVGWSAFNTARIEAGSPIFHIDFGRDSIPAETGILDEAVSFTKGCYLGQEIVARMHSLGHAKRVLVGLHVESDDLPLAGSQVVEPVQNDDTDSPGATSKGVASEGGASGGHNPVGGITSSAYSPILGRPVVFAVMKWGQHTPGKQVLVPTESGLAKATAQGLRFLDT